LGQDKGRAEQRRAASISGVRIRWRVFSMLAGFGVIVYFQQRAVTVAAERIMPELALSQMQLGWLQWAFLLSYGALQFPGGILGQRVGARRALAAMMLLAVFAAAVLPLTPLVLSGTVLFAALFAAQFLLGMAHAPFMPVCAGVMETWLPPNRYALAQGLHTAALQFGAALAPPVIVLLMRALGWQRALFWAALPPLLLIGVWAWYGRNSPAEHASVSSEELGELDAAGNEPADASISLERAGRILTHRAVLLLTLSYISMNYVFYLLANWCFLYLIQERHFTSLEGGMLASLPPLAAAVGAGTGGALTDRLCRRFGLNWGYRLLPLIALPLAGGLLIAAVASVNAYGAVAALTLAFGVIELTEGSYWAATMRIAKADTMAATGVLNTGGNLGGIIGIPIVAYLSGHHAWTATFVLGLALALLAAIAWLGVDATRPMVQAPHGR
jgi:MFS transporter, ACS family, glucarate transporter